MTSSPVVALAATPDQLAQVRTLMRAFVAWSRVRYAPTPYVVDKYFDVAAFEAELQALPGKYAPPRGCVLLATWDGAPAGCVAFRELDGTTCEMKRMFVYPQFHGSGVGGTLVRTLLAEAIKAGYGRMRLDTGDQQPEAYGLYRKFGFRDIPPYYDVPDDLRQRLRFMERTLEARPAAAPAPAR